MQDIIEHVEFPKIYRFSRPVIVTEKIDGTNGQVYIGEDKIFLVGSKKRLITPDNDNFGFARWCYENKEELIKLGPGRHYGEWWGPGIQRGYGLKERVFSLFNTTRWGSWADRPSCCRVVPILWTGNLDDLSVPTIMKRLDTTGSIASPGFMRPEGIVIYHVQANTALKKTFEGDTYWKGE